MPKPLTPERVAEIAAEARRVVADPATELTAHRALAEHTLFLIDDLSTVRELGKDIDELIAGKRTRPVKRKAPREERYVNMGDLGSPLGLNARQTGQRLRAAGLYGADGATQRAHDLRLVRVRAGDYGKQFVLWHPTRTRAVLDDAA